MLPKGYRKRNLHNARYPGHLHELRSALPGPPTALPALRFDPADSRRHGAGEGGGSVTHEFQPDHNGTYYCVRCGRTFMQLVEDLVTNPLAMQALECETGVLA
jgi:hypothetical protein